MSTLIFAPWKDAERLARSLGAELLAPGVMARQAQAIIRDFRERKVKVVVATQGWAMGWRAPLGTEVFFLDGFTNERGYREQAMARVGMS